MGFAPDVVDRQGLAAFAAAAEGWRAYHHPDDKADRPGLTDDEFAYLSQLIDEA
jgi:hypothetical protein